MSHYPTSAELQDFRRAIWPYPDLVEPAHGGAYGHEVREGIGAISAGKYWGVMYPDSTLPGEARREAAAMRSRAYSALDPQNYWLPRATMRTAAWDERRYGVPTLYRDCECCGNPAGKCDCYGIGC